MSPPRTRTQVVEALLAPWPGGAHPTLCERFMSVFGRTPLGMATYAAFLAAPGAGPSLGRMPGAGVDLTEVRLHAVLEAISIVEEWSCP